MVNNGSTNNGRVQHRLPTRAERDRAVKLYTETRLPVGEIAAHLRVSRSTIHRWLQAAGVELRGPMGPRESYLDELGVDETASVQRMAIVMEALGALKNGQASIEADVRELTKAVAELKGALEYHMRLTQEFIARTSEE